MKQSSTKSSTSSNSSKYKRSSKDREKRKSQSTSDSINLHNSDKGSPSKESNTRKYAGYGPEQLITMADQSLYELVSEEVCFAFTEDINYKLRHVIYVRPIIEVHSLKLGLGILKEALAKARLSSRNYINSADIDETFECLQIEKVFGAPSIPNWIPFGDQNLYYLDDGKVNLMNLAEQLQLLIQPIEPLATRKWLPETKDINKQLRNYFIQMCQAVVDKDTEVRSSALSDISKNNLIGPILEWLYHFGYFLLSKDITYDSLTLRAFDLIEALESNPVSAFTVSEKQIMLLARLLLQRLLRSVTTVGVLKPMCRVLAILCKRTPPRKMILKKIVSKFPEIREDFALSIVTATNELGLDAIYAIFLPHLKHLFLMIENQKKPELAYEILRTYNIMCMKGLNHLSLYNVFYDAFGDSILPIWKNRNIYSSDPWQLEYVWLNVKVQLLKSRRKVLPLERKKQKKIHIEEAFSDDDDDIIIIEPEMENQVPLITQPKMTFKFHSFAPAVGRLRFLNMPKFRSDQVAATHLIVGKRTLLAPVLGGFLRNVKTRMKCVDHSLMYYNL